MSASGSVSTVSRDDNLVSSSEDSSCPDDSDLQLGLGLSLGGGGAGNSAFKLQQQASFGAQYATSLTAKNFPSSSSFSSSSSSLGKPSHASCAKRSADSVANAYSQVVGWPPIRAYRMNNITNQAKSVATDEYNSMIEKNKRKNGVVENTTNGSNKNYGTGKTKTSLFVKVNMDGIPIGRKVDLSTHSCYETLAQTLEDMFLRPTINVTGIRSGIQEHDTRVEATRSLKLLDGMSDFVLTYEDKEGDWMLVGDVPWGMFLTSVKRLRIMRTSEATGLGPRIQESSGRQRNKPI
ncbi:auxin-responsive protein IAA11-like isoform X2 [Mangifera indica]|uniref:auxin-responsive protein IAA11-like isoform X2 n=1 Tax=Mangifera indica TaxID=29780 RepID=UPI001CF950DD|nr:auxin-responsive protein IAA11-like isoform X2 [Mangifera indica]